jgi:MHS family proline/betaine transporter-like MFS transporter
MLSDRIGRRPMAIAAALAVLVLTIPAFLLLTRHPTFSVLLGVEIGIAICLATFNGSIAALMAELFPTRARSTGLSLSYNFAVLIFGGFAPLAVTWLMGETGDRMVPAYYVTIAAILTLAALGLSLRRGQASGG